jgi:NitT/TauT family transport system permease protein
MKPAERATLWRFLSLASLILLWWAVARFAASPLLLPGPERVLAVTWQAVRSGDLPYAMGVTLARVAAAFVLSMLAGSVLGYVAGRSKRADAFLDPWLVVALNLPLLLVVVLVYIWVGLNEVAAVLAVMIAKTPTVMVTLREGARALDPALDEFSRVYRLPLGRRLRRVVWPQMMPYVAAAARGGLSITWKIVLVVELLGRPSGVGFALNLFFQAFDVARILAYGLAFAAVMLALEVFVLQPWERRTNAWR